MAGKIYKPTEEQLACWDEEMKHWRDAKLTNKEYYDTIDAEMAKFEQPAVGHAMEIMCEQGSYAYAQRWSHIKPTKFSGQTNSHEATHLCCRLGHTPEQEQFAAMFDTGFSLGIYNAKEIAENIDHALQRYRKLDKKFLTDENHKTSPITDRDKAIYIAAGMYLREKIEMFYHSEIHLEGPFTGRSLHGYDAQLQFSRNYANTDHVPDRKRSIAQECYDNMSSRSGSFADHIIKDSFPYELIKLTPKEWKAIIGVATGLAEPENTLYPKRMGTIKQVLIEAGVFHDVKPWMERTKKNHAEHHPKGEAFDPEKFKAAREKRGADGNERG